eukprot:8416558-Pyramimonas_sp.AAC.1
MGVVSVMVRPVRSECLHHRHLRLELFGSWLFAAPRAAMSAAGADASVGADESPTWTARAG